MSRNKFLKTLYANHCETVASIVKSTIYSNHPHDIEDCVHEVFLAALKNPELENHQNISGWLYITSRNISLQFNEKMEVRKKELLIINDDEAVFEPIVNDFSNQLIEDIEFEKLMKQGVLDDIISSLSQTERDFYHLRYVKKLSNKQISEITGKNDVAVRVRFSRLKEKIKKLVKEYVTNTF